ncbi:MAG: ATP-binding cassette domain-containing protein [Crocinitomicaceae bacterium]|nr:ATP-binding cassette domain-containing protein [Crocinitomicaceae bacterium]
MISISINKKLVSNGNTFNLELDFEARSAQVVTVYGPSGSGKTTFFRLLAGLEKPDNGKIVMGDTVWFDAVQKIDLSPQKRSIGYVFQDYALFPNMSIRENLEFGLPKGASKQIIEELIDIVELGELLERKPATLSGGQKQRVALARALVQQPKVLLLDEPFSSLDDQIRFKLLKYLIKVHQKYQFTVFMVSHQLSEILYVSEQVMCLDNGIITKRGDVRTVFFNENISSKMNLVGEVVSITKADIVYRLDVLSQNSLFSVIVTEDDVRDLSIGDKIMLTSKAFNPVVIRLEK